MKKYFLDEYDESLNAFEALSVDIGESQLSLAQSRQLQKFMMLFF
ncbi:MAG: hypothetical protein AAF806_32870 [Bacteroidota bacterium]